MQLRSKLKLVVSSFALLGAGGLAFAAEPAKGAAPATKPAYPLTTCVISDEKLGDMGKPVVIQHEGREVQFCCASCEKEFKKDPAKYLKKIDAAKKKPATQPSKKA
jgi:hypothetical protein